MCIVDSEEMLKGTEQLEEHSFTMAEENADID
jgi:hypothetical protein